MKTTTNLPDCGSDPIASLKNMFVDRTQMTRVLAGQCPVHRAVFLKPHGVVKATFTIEPNLDESLKVGIFKGTSYDAWVRFSSDTVPGNPDLKTTLGIGIKLFGVTGEKLLEADQHAPTADFILQNHDVFFVDTAKDMCEFTYAGVINHDYDSYLDKHPITNQILDDMAKTVASVAVSDYWSGLPYHFGDRYVKYKLSPVDPAPAPAIPSNNPDYLYDELKQRLLNGDVTFRFFIQLRTNDATMPIDAATVRWSETESEPIAVATLTLHQQNTDTPGQEAYGENLAYNPWHTIEAHKPAGSISDARKVVYQASADLRRSRNGVPACEPTHAR
jgi:hypothetical protein